MMEAYFFKIFKKNGKVVCIEGTSEDMKQWAKEWDGTYVLVQPLGWENH